MNFKRKRRKLKVVRQTGYDTEKVFSSNDSMYNLSPEELRQTISAKEQLKESNN